MARLLHCPNIGRFLVVTVVALSLSASAASAGVVGSEYTIHNKVFGAWVVRTYRVHTVSTFGHDPGKCWTLARLVKLSISDSHSVGARVADAEDNAGLALLDVMAEYDHTTPGQFLVGVSPHNLNVPLPLFDNSDGLLTGDVLMQMPQGASFAVADTINVPIHFNNGIEPEFNLDTGAGLQLSSLDPEYTGMMEGSSLVVPEPAAMSLVALAITLVPCRGRRGRNQL